MQVEKIVIPYRRNDIFRFYDLGDIHGGTLHCAESKARAAMNTIIQDPFSFWLDKGDKVECVTPNDPRWDFGILAPWLNDPTNISRLQEDWYKELVWPAVKATIADTDVGKCLGTHEGNHESALRLHNNGNIQANICKDLGIKDLGFSCIYHILFHRRKSNEKHLIKVHSTHGSGYAQTKGGKLQKLKKIMAQTDCRITSIGHLHDIIIETQPVMTTTDKLVLKERPQVGAVTGSFLRTYTQDVPPGYGERKNYDPVPLGCVVYEICPDVDTVIPSPMYF